MIGIIGQVSSGKSSVINSILGEFRAATSLLRCTTDITEYKSTLGTLVDFPGVNDTTSKEFDKLTFDNISRVDILCYVTEAEKVFLLESEVKFLTDIISRIHANNKEGLGPYHLMVIVNKFDTASGELKELFSKAKSKLDTICVGIPSSIISYSAHQAFMERSTEKYRNSILTGTDEKLRDEIKKIKKNAGDDTEQGYSVLSNAIRSIDVSKFKDEKIIQYILCRISSVTSETMISVPPHIANHRYSMSYDEMNGICKNINLLTPVIFTCNIRANAMRLYLLQYLTGNQYRIKRKSIGYTGVLSRFLYLALGYSVHPPLAIRVSQRDKLVLAREHLDNILECATLSDYDRVYYNIYAILSKQEAVYLPSMEFDMKRIIRVYGVPLYLLSISKSPVSSEKFLGEIHTYSPRVPAYTSSDAYTHMVFSEYVYKNFGKLRETLTREEILMDPVARCYSHLF